MHTAYALLGEPLSEADIDFDCYEPQIANELFSVIEPNVNLNYRAEPPLCGSCQEEAYGSAAGD